MEGLRKLTILLDILRFETPTRFILVARLLFNKVVRTFAKSAGSSSLSPIATCRGCQSAKPGCLMNWMHRKVSACSLAILTFSKERKEKLTVAGDTGNVFDICADYRPGGGINQVGARCAWTWLLCGTPRARREGRWGCKHREDEGRSADELAEHFEKILTFCNVLWMYWD